MIAGESAVDLSDLTDDQLTELARSCVAEAVTRGEATARAAQSILLSAYERQQITEQTRHASSEQQRLAAIRALRDEIRAGVDHEIASGRLIVLTDTERATIELSVRAESIAVGRKSAEHLLRQDAQIRADADRAAEGALRQNASREAAIADLVAAAAGTLPCREWRVSVWRKHSMSEDCRVYLDDTDPNSASKIRFDVTDARVTASNLGHALKGRAALGAWCARAYTTLSGIGESQIVITIDAGAANAN